MQRKEPSRIFQFWHVDLDHSDNFGVEENPFFFGFFIFFMNPRR